MIYLTSQIDFRVWRAFWAARMMSSEAAPYSPVSYGKYYYSSLASILSFIVTLIGDTLAIILTGTASLYSCALLSDYIFSLLYWPRLPSALLCADRTWWENWLWLVPHWDLALHVGKHRGESNYWLFDDLKIWSNGNGTNVHHDPWLKFRKGLMVMKQLWSMTKILQRLA